MHCESPLLSEILTRLDILQEAVERLGGKQKPADPDYLPLTEGARLAGRSAGGLRRWLSRLGDQADAPRVRRIWGRVHAADLRAALDWVGSRKERRDENFAKAIDEMEGR